MSQPETLTEQQLTPDREQKIRRNYADCDSDFTVNVLLAEIDRLRTELQGRPVDPDSLPAWLYQRFMAGGVGWENLDADDRAYWEHQARAVRRAVARGGFKAAAPDGPSGATTAPLAASQPPKVPTEPETATEAPEGRVGDSGTAAEGTQR